MAEGYVTRVRGIARWVLGCFFIAAGLAHLTGARAEFRAQVPAWLPLDEDLVVVLSGIVEIALGLAVLLVRGHRRRVGWVIAAFLVAVFPGNLAQYVEGVDAFGLTSDGARLTRLFFQPLLIAWALWSTGALWGATRSFDDHT